MGPLLTSYCLHQHVNKVNESTVDQLLFTSKSKQSKWVNFSPVIVYIKI